MSAIWSENFDSPFIIDFYISVMSGALITNQTKSLGTR